MAPIGAKIKQCHIETLGLFSKGRQWKYQKYSGSIAESSGITSTRKMLGMPEILEMFEIFKNG